MKIKAKEFGVCLSRVLPLCRKQTTLPILTCVLVQAAKGSVRVTGTDIDAFAAATCDCEDDLEPICVDAVALNYLVHQAEGDVVLIKGERGCLVETDKGNAMLGIQPGAEYPPWPSQKSTALGINTTDLAQCIKNVEWAATAPDRFNPDMWKESVWVRMTAKTMECCGTNSKEFAYVKMAAVCAPGEFLFPAKSANLFVEALQTGANSVHLSESWIATVGDRFEVAIKLTDEKYIPVEYLVNQDQQPLGKLDLPALLDSLHTIRALGHNEPWIPVHIEFSRDGIVIRSCEQKNHFERTLPGRFEKKHKINVDALRAIKVFSHVKPEATAGIGSASLMFQDGDYTYALALMAGRQ